MNSLQRALLVSLALGSSTAVAETVRYTGMTYYGSASIYRDGSYFGTFAAGAMNVTIDGDPASAYCVDLDHYITSSYSASLVDVRDYGGFSSDQACTMNYILGNFEASSSATAAAIQIAMWKTVYGDENLYVSQSSYESAAQAIYDEAEGTCPIWCDADLVLDASYEGTTEATVFMSLQALDGTDPIVGEYVDVAVDSGTILTDSDEWYTDDSGVLLVEVAPDLADPAFTIDFTIDGSTLYVLVPDGSSQQLLAYTYETCSWSDSDSFAPLNDLGDPRTIGFWKHQIKEKGNIHVDRSVIEGWLDGGIDLFSDFTVEDWDEAYDTLMLKNASMQERAQQQCLATWFNIQYGELGWFSDIDGEYFSVLWTEAQDAYDAGDYEAAKDVCDGVNNL